MTEEERNQIFADFEAEMRRYKIGQAALMIGIALCIGILAALIFG